MCDASANGKEVMNMSVNDPEIHRETTRVGGVVRDLVAEWPFFAKDTGPGPMVRAADSTAANLSEGCGRNHVGENQGSCRHFRGFARETRTWSGKPVRRNPIPDDTTRDLRRAPETFLERLNARMRSIGRVDSDTNDQSPMTVDR